MIRALVTATFAIVTMMCVLSSAGAQAHPAWGIVVDRQGQVYFSDLKTVWRVDANGKVSVFRAANGRHTHELSMDESGNVYGVDNYYDPATQRFLDSAWKMSPAGGLSYIFAPTENPPKGMSIWRDRSGNMYSVEQNNHLKRETMLLKRTPDGKVSVLAGGRYGHADGKGSRAKFSSIVGMTFGPDGSLYLVDDSGTRKVSMDGMVTTLVRQIKLENAADNSAGGSSLFGIAVDAQVNAFVADYGNRRILKVAPNGQMTTLIRSEESWFPTGVAERGGGLYILEESHTPEYKPLGTRVRQLSPDETLAVLTTIGENRTSTENPSNGEKSSGEGANTAAESRRYAQYALLGAGIGAFALTFVVWRVRGRASNRQQRNS